MCKAAKPLHSMGIDTWSPLFSSIVQSSVWGQPPHVKIVWITMLALKDKAGFVASSVSGLARASVVTMAQCHEALEIFESPDADSKSQENEGMKVRRVEGGWMILGHERFQQKMREVSEKIGNAKRQAAFRERRKSAPKESREMRAIRLREDGKSRAFCKAEENGDQAQADRIAADEEWK